MKLNRLQTVNLLINRYQKGIDSSFLTPLQEEEVQALEENGHTFYKLQLLFPNLEEQFEGVHYSWLMPAFESMSQELIPYALMLLPAHSREKLSEKLSVLPKEMTLSRPLRRFLLGKLSKEFQEKLSLTIEEPPASPLDPLLQRSKKELLKFIDLLAIFEITESIKTVVDKARLSQVYSSLTMQERKFLAELRQEKRPLFSLKLSLSEWDGSKESLRKLLHTLGMIRLSGALHGEREEFINSLLLRLDIGRANKIKKLIEKKEIISNAKAMRKQVEKLLQFLKTGETP